MPTSEQFNLGNTKFGATGKQVGSKIMGIMKSNPIGAIMTATDYFQSRKEGASVPGALLKTAASAVFWDIMGPWGLAITAAEMAPVLISAGSQAYQTKKSKLANINKPFYGTKFKDTDAAYTMRQRAVQAIQDSKLNARSALGNEAQYFHR